MCLTTSIFIEDHMGPHGRRLCTPGVHKPGALI